MVKKMVKVDKSDYVYVFTILNHHNVTNLPEWKVPSKFCIGPSQQVELNQQHENKLKKKAKTMSL